MVKTEGRLLLLAFTWCPRGGVGSRRWSKFAKYLTRSGLAVDVISGEYPRKDAVNWCHDIEGNDRIRTFRTPSGYPSYLLRPKRNFLIKLGDRILSRSTHRLDYAEQWHRWMLPRIDELVRKNKYAAVVMTVGPFSPLRAVGDIRRKHPSIPLILDFRDPWAYLLDNVQGYSSDEVLAIERKAMELASEVWVTTVEHKVYTLEKYGVPASKVRVVTNGFDPEDFQDQPVTEVQEDRWVAVYAGSITGERLETLKHLLNALHLLDDATLKEKLRIHVYSNSDIPLKRFSDAEKLAYSQYVRRNPVVAPTELYSILAKARFGLTLDVERHRLTIPSKVFDSIGLGKKIIYLGPEGSIPQDLGARGHYCSTINGEEIMKMLRALIMQESNSVTMAGGENTGTYSLDRISKQVMKTITEISEEMNS